MALKVGADDLLLDPTSSRTRRRRPPRAERRSTHLLRSDKLVHEVVLVGDAPFVPLIVEKRKKQTEYGAKAVRLSQQRYIVCVNHQEAHKGRGRAPSVLERQLKKGDKALVPRLSRHPRRRAFRHRPRQGRRFDGLFISARPASSGPRSSPISTRLPRPGSNGVESASSSAPPASRRKPRALRRWRRPAAHRPTDRQQPTQPAPKCSAWAPTWHRVSASYDLPTWLSALSKIGSAGPPGRLERLLVVRG
jgi:hypothetical protein